MLRLAAGVAFYNDAQSLMRCLPTLSEFDYIFAIDGIYKGFSGKSELSDDGSREVVKSFSNTILIDAPNLEEFQKRNVYFEMSRQYNVDFLLIIDSDEWLEGDFSTFRWFLNNRTTPAKQLYRLPVEDHLKRDWYRFYARVALSPAELEYRRVHWAIARKTDKIGDWVSGNRVGYADGLRIRHDHSLRLPEYLQSREEYQKALKKYELNVNIKTLEHEDEAIERIKREMQSVGFRA